MQFSLIYAAREAVEVVLVEMECLALEERDARMVEEDGGLIGLDCIGFYITQAFRPVLTDSGLSGLQRF